ncbi:MAG: phage portal protein [Chloroflexi bacterium HGW-Chloroflexi-9]|nr:MAG: phage portal protein [Chloroflexi bacterium HGW-Chloroflexi-9]
MPPETILKTMARGFRAAVTVNGSEWGDGKFLTNRAGNRGGSIALVGNRAATYEAIYRTQPWVRAAVDRVSNGIGRLPWAAYIDAEREGERERVRTGPLAELLESPFVGGYASLLKQAMVKNLMIHENVVLVKVRPGPGRPPDELLPSSFAYWTVVPGTNGRRIDWYVFNGEIGGKVARIPFLPSEVVHTQFWGTGGGLTGDTRMEALRTTLMIEDATQRAIIAAFENGVRPIGAYAIDGTYKNKEAAERARAQLNEVYGGVDQAFKIMLLEGGAKWQEMSHNFVDSDIVNLRKLTRNEVAAVLNVPPPVIGQLEEASFSNITEQHLMEYMDTFQPYTVLIQESLREQLIKPEPLMAGQYVEFNFKAMLQGDPLKEIEAGVKAVGGPYMTVNEFRATQNMPPVPGGDTLYSPPNTAGQAPAGAARGAE